MKRDFLIIDGTLIVIIGIISVICFELILLLLLELVMNYTLEYTLFEAIKEAIKIAIGLSICYYTVIICKSVLISIGYIQSLRDHIEYYRSKI